MSGFPPQSKPTNDSSPKDGDGKGPTQLPWVLGVGHHATETLRPFRPGESLNLNLSPDFCWEIQACLQYNSVLKIQAK
jgi:hypothetical protein